jgi:L-ascorbate metabolism protein UlaG (beta-lactamase superfamily)
MCFLGHISGALPTDTSGHFEEVDILFIPAGGKPFLEQKAAAKLIKQIKPKIVIPSFYKVPGLKRQTVDLKTFLEECGLAGRAETQEKLTVKKKDFGEIKKAKLVALKI